VSFWIFFHDDNDDDDDDDDDDALEISFNGPWIHAVLLTLTYLKVLK
jgi:hypothetical protein